jgi:hypothetical protein
MTAPCVECGNEDVLHSFLCGSCLSGEYLRLLDVVDTQRQESLTTKQALASALADVERLKAKAEKLEKGLQHIANQWLPESMGPNIRKNADWEGAYEMMVQLAREALQP